MSSPRGMDVLPASSTSNTSIDATLAGATGRGVSVAVLDSGVHASHPHVNGVAGGAAIGADGSSDADYVDRIGHGTAVMAAIKERAPQAECYAVRIFDRKLSTTLATLVAAIDWAVDREIKLINLSLGTPKAEHREALSRAVSRAVERGLIIVAARDDENVEWLPGSLPGVIPVRVDWACPREVLRVDGSGAGTVVRASGYPRSIPGVPPERNLSGISFAVANTTGFVARFLESRPDATCLEALAWCGEFADSVRA